MKKCFLVLVSLVVFVSMLFSFVAAAETSEPESFSIDESSTSAMETSSSLAMETSSESSSVSSPGFSDEQEAIINRLDLIYTLGLFFVAFLAALLVMFILWRVLDTFI